uniref:Uncharacterized protein n=1 Tax=Acrobeloides nanus TaxID=290746 RepID=A0A914CTS3_9BILA
MIASFCNTSVTDWPKFLPLVTAAYNSSIHVFTRETPFFIMHGYDMRLPSDVGNLPEQEEHSLDIPQYKRELFNKLNLAHE